MKKFPVKQIPKSIDIIYETSHFLVLNKPPNCYSQPPTQPTILELLEKSYPQLFSGDPVNPPFCKPPKMVQRLDFPVTGAMLLAKSTQAAKLFSRNLRKKGSYGSPIQKRYIALISTTGYPDFWTNVSKHCKKVSSTGLIEGQINIPLNDKEALTKFWIPESMKNDKNLLVGMEPCTGRKHQLRLHALNGLGAPIIGDVKYGHVDDNLQETHIALHSAQIKGSFGQTSFDVKAQFKWNNSWKTFIGKDGLLLRKDLYIENENKNYISNL